MTAIWRVTLQNLRLDWRAVLTTHLVFVVLGVVLFTPLISLLGRLVVGLSDKPALADQDIAWFLLSPAGIIGVLVLAAVAITILAFELASLMALGAARSRDLHLGAAGALRHTTAHAFDIFAFAARLVLRVLALTGPFVAVAAGIAWYLLTDYDINYYLAEQPSEFWIAAGGIALVLLAMTALLVSRLLAWSMALPLVLFSGVAPGDSFAASAGVTAGHRRELLRVMLLWAAFALALAALVAAVVLQLGEWIVPRFFDSISWLVPVLGALVVLWMLGNFAVTVFTSGSFAYALITLYGRQAGEDALDNLAIRAGAEPAGGMRLSAPQLWPLLIGAVLLAIVVGNWLLNGIRISDTVTVIAHRGAAGTAPENTLASIRQAIEDGADWVEIDVQESADGEVVVIHDSDFMKLANIDLKVWDGTLAELREIDVGSWFDPDFADERVPTLAEVLALAKGHAGVVIELKYYGHDQQLEQRVVDIVEATGMVDQVAIMSLKYEGIQKIRALRPAWTIGLLSATAVGNLARLDVDFLAVARGMATPGFVRRSQAEGKQVFVWTINDAVSLSRMMSLGVDGVITDEPALAQEVMTARADLNPAERLLMHTAVLFGRPEPTRSYRDDSP